MTKVEQVELDERYAECCRNSKNWEYCCRAGEVYCNKCGRVLPEEIVLVVLN